MTHIDRETMDRLRARVFVFAKYAEILAAEADLMQKLLHDLDPAQQELPLAGEPTGPSLTPSVTPSPSEEEAKA